MSWSQAQQDAATQAMMGYIAQVNQQFEAWTNALRSGQQDQSKAALEETLRLWRGSIQQLRATSDSLMMTAGELDMLNALIQEMTDSQQTLSELVSKSGTRGEQAHSLNPKTVASPYTNILGLQRIFRPSTRTNLLIASIVFAVLALMIIVYIVLRFVSQGTAAAPASYSGIQAGGSVR